MDTAMPTAPKKPAADGRPPAEQALLNALKANSEATAADLAVAAGVGRSTAGKALSRLASSGEIRRTEGGRDGARRLPDRFSLAPSEPASAGSPPPAADAASSTTSDDAKPETAEDPEPNLAVNATPEVPPDRLRPGQLDGLVLGFLEENIDGGPHGAATVARALKRSSGAVSNCLARLTNGRQVRLVSDKPRLYSLAR